MIEHSDSQPTSVGAAWPPQVMTHERLRGFYDEVVTAPHGLEEFVNQFDKYKEEVVNHPDIDRLSIRVVTGLGMISTLEGLGIGLEGAMPIRGHSDLMIVYTAWNGPDRLISDDILGHHLELIGNTVATEKIKAGNTVNLSSQGFRPKTIDRATPDTTKQHMAERFVDLYSNFGYSVDEVEELLLNPDNTIAYIEDDAGVVSTALAERAVIEVDKIGAIKVAEITEAFTLPRYRGRGLYKSISGFLIDKLIEEEAEPLDVIYGESNLAMPGVVIAAHQNGRRFSHLDRERLGINQPGFGILQQNFHVEDGTETRRFNDFALSYVPLD